MAKRETFIPCTFQTEQGQCESAMKTIHIKLKMSRLDKKEGIYNQTIEENQRKVLTVQPF